MIVRNSARGAHVYRRHIQGQAPVAPPQAVCAVMTSSIQHKEESVSKPRVIVIGAGFYGLAAAKTFLEISPSASLTIIDESSHVGGVWSHPRIFPGVIADSPSGLFDFSDSLMKDAIGIEEWADIPAEKVADYLELYAEKFALRERCMLSTKVLRATKNDDEKEWTIEIQKIGPDSNNDRKRLSCDKLIVATGLFSAPAWPDIDFSCFEGPVMHSHDVGLRYKELLDEKHKEIVVVGGNKSAVDVITMCALAGETVNWLIREEGNGATMLFQIRRHGIHGAVFASGRWSSIPSPSILAIGNFWYRFLHSGKSGVGKWLMENYWKKGTAAAFGNIDKLGENRRKLTPKAPDVFWSTSAISVLHSPTFMEMVDKGEFIDIHRAYIASFNPNSVVLNNGTTLNCSAVIFASGWERTQPKLFSPSQLEVLGIPFPLSQQSPEYEKRWSTLDTTADDKVCTTFPFLRNPPPVLFQRNVPTTPFRLFRYIVSPTLSAGGDRSIAFLGCLSNIRNASYAEVSALWATAYLLDLLPDPINEVLADQAEMETQVSEMNAWELRRYRDKARRYPVGGLEIQDFIDMLMRDLGLDPERKRGKGPRGILGLRAWAREWFWPYMAVDYKGIVQEFKAGLEKRGMQSGI